MINILIQQSSIYALKNLTVAQRYEKLQNLLPVVLLKDLKYLNMNLQTKYELSYLDNQTVLKMAQSYIQKYAPRKRNVKILLNVLNALYQICQDSISGMCFPSVEKLTLLLGYKNKMRVSRALKDLEKLKILEIYAYYINEKHYFSCKKPCHCYYLKPPSLLFGLYVPQAQQIQFKGLHQFIAYLKSISKCTNESTIYCLQQFTKEKSHAKFNTF